METNFLLISIAGARYMGSLRSSGSDSRGENAQIERFKAGLAKRCHRGAHNTEVVLRSGFCIHGRSTDDAHGESIWQLLVGRIMDV